MADQVTLQEFSRRLIDLVVKGGVPGLPRKRRDRHILLKSVVLTLEKTAEYSEPEINRELKHWLGEIGSSLRWDHVELRRHLVNEEYLGRSKDGSRYWVAVSSRKQIPFAAEVENADVLHLVREAQAEMESRKQAYLSG